jgi:CubicO group peptidase (beta-lactamase class C family)
MEVLGTPSLNDSTPLRRDAIFRIASLTKPIAAAGAMALVDDGVLSVREPVDRYLPELAGRRVLRRLDGPLDDTVPADRSITVEDLLTCRLGFGSIMEAPPGTFPVQIAEEELGLKTLGPSWPPPPFSSDEWIARFATLPLLDQPGAVWRYNTGLQVLGVLIERASGRPLEDYLRSRLLEPLGMADTAFSVPAEKQSRFTTAYEPDETGELRLLDPPTGGWWNEPPALANAAGMLVSTLNDFWAFVSMLLGGGEYNGERVLSAGSVAAMTSNQLTPEQRAAARLFLGEHGGWGYGMGTPGPIEGEPPKPWGNGWTGGTGTVWWSDPVRGLTGILLTQRAMTSPEPPAIFNDFVDAAYGAMEE